MDSVNLQGEWVTFTADRDSDESSPSLTTGSENRVDLKGFQRIGSVSNAHVGRDFEAIAAEFLSASGIDVQPNFPVLVGIEDIKKPHRFDLGSDDPPIIVECKSHRWTAGGNVPSAKMTVWNEVMYYFSVAPSRFRRILFVLFDRRHGKGESLAEYYIRTYAHLIPSGVEIWEFNPEDQSIKVAKRTVGGA